MADPGVNGFITLSGGRSAILPPAVGQSNALYEALPQGPGTTDYTIPGAQIGVGNVNGPVFSGATIQGPGISQGSPAGSTTTAPAGSAVPRITVTPSPGQSGTVSQGSVLTAGSLADYFARAIIIVLGFIFVAVGLNMLRPGTIPGASVARRVTRPI